MGEGSGGGSRWPENTPYEQKNIADIACRGRDPLTYAGSAIAKTQTVFTAELLNADEDAVGRMLKPVQHCQLERCRGTPDVFNDAGFGLHLLGHWARMWVLWDERAAPTHAHPATVFGIKDRGLIREGRPPTCCCSNSSAWAVVRNTGCLICSGGAPG
jgi:N-acyl-D-aspartate/D-glutamate deacylase